MADTYQTYQATPEATQQNPSEGVRVYDHQGAVQITMSGDGQTSLTTRGKNSFSTSDLGKDTHGDSWKATAISAKGLPTSTITAESVVTLGGIQGRVRDFVSAGRLREVSPGQFEEASQEATQENAEETPQDAAVMPEEVRAAVNAAIEPLPAHARPAVVSLVANMATGDTTMEQVVSRFVAESGIHPDDARQRIEFSMKAHQAQTDAYLVHREGIPASELPQFYDAVRKNPRGMKSAMLRQANGSMSGWRELVAKYNVRTVPPMANVVRAGLETRNISGTPEVKIGNVWCSIHGATRAGLI